MKIKIIAAIACFSLIGIFFYLSVLGENDQAKEVAKSFFADIKNNKYSAAGKFYTKTSQERSLSPDDSTKFHFILELTLLKHFGLMDEQDYNLKVKRESFWFPLIGDNEILLGIELLKKDKSSSFFHENKKFLHEFITVAREDGTWRIKSLNLEKSDLLSSFDKIQSEIDLNKYIEIHQGGFIIKKTNVNTAKMNRLEKMVIIHSLETALEKLQISDNK